MHNLTNTFLFSPYHLAIFANVLQIHVSKPVLMNRHTLLFLSLMSFVKQRISARFVSRVLRMFVKIAATCHVNIAPILFYCFAQLLTVPQISARI